VNVRCVKRGCVKFVQDDVLYVKKNGVPNVVLKSFPPVGGVD